ncbi:MAG TPA: DUF4175 family protein [bacterium]|jgi:hypothetical protein
MGAREVLLTIHTWMGGLRRAVLTNRLKTGALTALAGLIAISLVIMIVEALGHLSGTARAVLLALWGISALAALGLGVVWPVLRFTVFAPDDKTLAGDYARRMPSIRDRVLNALQLLERVEGANREGYSPELILEAGREVAEDLRPLDPRTLPEKRPVQLSGRLAMVAGGVAVLLFLFAGESLLSAGERVMKPGQDFEPPAPFALSVKPGNAQLVRGDSLIVEVTASGKAPAAITIERLEKGKNASEPINLKSDNGVFRYVYRSVSAPFTYWAHEGRVKTPEYDVQVQELPAVRFLSLRLAPPAYTRLPEQVLDENVGDVAAVIGTKVHLELAATKKLSRADMEFLKPAVSAPPQDSASLGSPPFEKGGTKGGGGEGLLKSLTVEGSRASTDFSVTESGYYKLHLKDADGLENRDPILYRITARPDEPPLVSLVQPSQDVDIAASSKVPVTAEAMDDFGFTRMALRYYRTTTSEPTEAQSDESKYKSLPLDYHLIEPGKARGEMTFDLSALDLLPEDQVLIFVEAWDNDGIHGPKRARSETRTLRFPSMSELFEKQDQEAETREISLADLLKESQDIRQKVDEAVQDFKSNPEMSWEKKQEIQKLLDKQQAMNEALKQISEQMQKASDQMNQQAMFSPQVMDKFQKIQELVKEVITPEMRQALQRLQQTMKQPSEEEVRKALENFKMTQEMFEKALDQALNLLQQLKTAKKLDELTRRLDELGRKQDQLNEKMDQNTPQSSPQNSEEQKKLAEEMAKIQEEAKKLSEEMQKQNMQAKEKMQALQQEMEQEQLPQEMQKNSQTMSMNQNQSAKKKGRQMRRKMSEFSEQMQSIRQQMQTDQDLETLQKLERTRDQLLDLSMRQEKLWKDSEKLQGGSPQLAQSAEEQENLRQELSRVNDDVQNLAKQSMFVTPQLMAGIYGAMQQMEQAGGASQSRDPRTMGYYRQLALGALNSALKESNQSCSSCRSACSKPSPNSAAGKAGMMAMQQQQLNQQTQDMMGNNNPGTLTVGQQAGMQKLAVEQRALQKSAQELSQEAAASQQSLGRLDDVAKEMEEVAKDLENRNVTDRTTEKQEHIESRLLDFQRAQREKEFSPQRQSRPGMDVVRASPQQLPSRPGTDQLREDLLRALDAKYTPDYEQLIRQYFDALSKWK